MSMNGRRQRDRHKYAAAAAAAGFGAVQEHQEAIIRGRDEVDDDFPPPPEEAQRLIATLLPKVSPSHRPKLQNIGRYGQNRSFPLTQLSPRSECIPPPHNFQNFNGMAVQDQTHTATQTTLPKTKHQRPYGWSNNSGGEFVLRAPPPPPGYRFGSLPFQQHATGPGFPITSPTRLPPRTVPTTAAERHREVKRHGSEDNLSSDLDDGPGVLRPLSELADDEHFSDDSLEEALPPPPPPVCNKRASIAWEVPLDDEALLTPVVPGSTKVIGRRRRKSGSYSSTSSIPNRLKELDDWPDPPPCTTEDEVTSPFSDSDDHIMLPPELNSANLSGNSTYIIRRGKGKKDRKNIGNLGSSLTSNSSLNSRLSSELSISNTRFSSDMNSRLSRELQTPNSRYSIDLSTPHSRLSQELNSPKSRYSLDLNNSRLMSQDLSSSPSRLSVDLSSSRSSTPSKHNNEIKRHSTTFDNIKSLVREGLIQDSPKMETAMDLNTPLSPIVRVVSLPSLNAEDLTPRRELDVTVEEEEEAESSQPSTEISPLRQIEQNISELLERRDIEVVQDEQFILNGMESLNRDKKDKKKPPSKPTRDSRGKNDLQKSSSHNEIQKSEEYYRQLLMEGGNPFPKRNGIQKSESAKEMKLTHQQRDPRQYLPMPTSTSADFPAVRAEVHAEKNDLPPLPPSPVEEDDDEYQEVVDARKQRAGTLPEAPAVPPHSSLRTRSMDANYNRGRHRNYCPSGTASSTSSSRHTTLPEVPPHRAPRRPFAKQRSAAGSPQDEMPPPLPAHGLQTSCSLPETPIFARGCDVPRTPHRKAPDVPGGGSQTAPRQSNTIGSLNTVSNLSTSGYRRGTSQSGLEQAIVGAELLRLAGGPGRGWYPKQRQRRPASIEHLDRTSANRTPWESSRKPLTLPPNLTPKFFQRSPRDALRRVTSLLIKKGNNGKETKKEKDAVSPTIHENANGEEVQKKKGFFKNFWKRSRHYSLEQQ
ncbi:unnamed protein product [Acanthoscelides obtectus]|uniref:Uncharacterized protein n=1 Tax=Acanthoscelides obtectus TaxID=200917 RepID=A0A9P0PX20_ACAOB|nr:unnamed protein product [Acanthoscelides obtectus]CAK1677452.1 hypothetical protein AOBTE_LOCUS31336 [Acanthoscelides obtectus]